MLTADGVVVRYGRAQAVRSVGLAVPDGSAVGLVGESGSGKTSLARALVGLVDHRAHVAGSSTIDGDDFDLSDGTHVQHLLGSEIGFIPQGAMSALNPVIRIADQIAESLVYHRGKTWKQARSEAGDHLERVGIPGGRARAFPHEFSGGMRQRVAIALVLAAEPSMVIADEPTVGLDAAIQGEILELLVRLRAELGLSLLLVTHDLDAVRTVCDRVAVMYAGRIVERGALDEVTAEPRHPYTRALLASMPGRTGHTWRPIAGSAPDPAELPAGCAFVPRCPHADETCARIDPDLVGGRHEVACHHSERTAMAEDPPARPAQPVRHGADAIVDCSGLTVRYDGGIEALVGVDLEIARGEIVGLVGPSGSGKSTLGAALLGLVEPAEGRVVVDGVDVGATGARGLRRLRRGTVGLVQQDPYDSLHPAMTVAALVGEPLRWHRGAGRSRGEAVAAALSEAGLDPTDEILRTRPDGLSGGQRQRVALARALVMAPSVLVADEPTSMLDVSIRAGIARRLSLLRDRTGLTILFITHDLAEAEALCDRIVELDRGRICGERSTEPFRARLAISG